MRAASLVSILAVAFNMNLSFGQLSWKINLEAGSYSTSNSILKEKSDFSLRSEGDVKYNYETQSSKSFLQLKVRPEIFGISNKLYALKLKASGGFVQTYENYDWGVNFSAQNHSYSGESISANFTSYFLQTNISYPISNTSVLLPNAGYAYQNIDFNGRRSIDIIFMDLKLESSFNQYFRFGYGLYGEKFTLLNEQYLFNRSNENTNSGFRIGPQISVNYIRSLIISGEVRFLIHESKVTRYPSYEQLFRFVGGKILTEDLTLMLLIDFYTRNFTEKFSNRSESNLLYTPINLENRFYLKLSYDFDDSLELFSKVGYSKEYLYDRDLSLSGWNVSVGISLNN